MSEHKYNPFYPSGVMTAMKGVFGGAKAIFGKMWNSRGEKASFTKNIVLFLPRVIGTVVVGAVYLATSAVVANIGAITAGVIAGTVQVSFGLGKLVSGIFRQDSQDCKEGLGNVGKGLLKFVGGAVIAGGTAFAVAIGVGAPAIALLTPIGAGLSTSTGIPALIGQGMLALGPVIATANAGLATAVAAVASAAPVLIIAAQAAAVVQAAFLVGATAKAAAEWVRAKVTNKSEVKGQETLQVAENKNKVTQHGPPSKRFITNNNKTNITLKNCVRNVELDSPKQRGPNDGNHRKRRSSAP